MRLVFHVLFILTSSFSASLQLPTSPIPLLCLSLLIPVSFLLATHHRHQRLQGAVGLLFTSLSSLSPLLIPLPTPLAQTALQICLSISLALFFSILPSYVHLTSSRLRLPWLLVLPWLATFPLGLLISSLFPASGPLLLLPPSLSLIHSLLALILLETERSSEEVEAESSEQLSYTSSSSISISSSSSITVFPTRPKAVILTSGVSAPDLHLSSLSTNSSSYQRSDFFLRLLEEQEQASTLGDVLQSSEGLRCLFFGLIISVALPLIASTNNLYTLTAAATAPLSAGLINLLTSSGQTGLPTFVLLLVSLICLLISSQPPTIFICSLLVTTTIFLPLVHLPSPPQLILHASSISLGISFGLSLSLLPDLPSFTPVILLLLSMICQTRAIYKETQKCWSRYKGTKSIPSSEEYDNHYCCK